MDIVNNDDKLPFVGKKKKSKVASFMLFEFPEKGSNTLIPKEKIDIIHGGELGLEKTPFN